MLQKNNIIRYIIPILFFSISFSFYGEEIATISQKLERKLEVILNSELNIKGVHIEIAKENLFIDIGSKLKESNLLKLKKQQGDNYEPLFEWGKQLFPSNILRPRKKKLAL